MAEYILRIEDKRALSALKKLISYMPGVTLSPVKKKRKTGIDEAIDDVKAGRVTRYESVDAFFKDMGY